MVVRTAGDRVYLWRAVDHEGEILDLLVQRRRDKRAAQPRHAWTTPGAGLVLAGPMSDPSGTAYAAVAHAASIPARANPTTRIIRSPTAPKGSDTELITVQRRPGVP